LPEDASDEFVGREREAVKSRSRRRVREENGTGSIWRRPSTGSRSEKFFQLVEGGESIAFGWSQRAIRWCLS
jgi:hypothetical protein